MRWKIKYRWSLVATNCSLFIRIIKLYLISAIPWSISVWHMLASFSVLIVLRAFLFKLEGILIRVTELILTIRNTINEVHLMYSNFSKWNRLCTQPSELFNILHGFDNLAYSFMFHLRAKWWTRNCFLSSLLRWFLRKFLLVQYLNEVELLSRGRHLWSVCDVCQICETVKNSTQPTYADVLGVLVLRLINSIESNSILSLSLGSEASLEDF